MKWLLSSIVLITFGVDWISAYAVNSEICVSQKIHQSKAKTKCIENFMNVTEFLHELDKLSDWGDEVAARVFAQKYCPNRTQVINCVPIALNISEECRDKQDYNRRLIRFRVMGVIFNFMCDNDAEALMVIIPNNGFKYEANHCAEQLDEISLFEKSETDQPNPLHCEVLRSVADCYSGASQIGEKKNVPHFLSIFYAKIRQALGCQ